MLRKFLRLAFGRDTAETADVARELGVSINQVRLMIETLERLGYLEKVAAGSEQSCERCAVNATCLLIDCPHMEIDAQGGALPGGRYRSNRIAVLNSYFCFSSPLRESQGS